jgi:arsenate reductase
MSIVLYGIPNCDTVKKARAWLADQGADYQFHDFKKDGVPADRLDPWIAAVGWEKLVNRKGTTWRKLDAQLQASVQDAASAKAVMLAQPSVIKRPVVEWKNHTTVGFTAADFYRSFTGR